ncbi:UTP--glucose-1-phosphate uridylyltransferase GalU [Terribacillus saccharophilus]|uniref:UTP--glucose-1-phosphate uridylyltransferase n=1 Tax=Terribacillus saccharophilus TaxID=361277 RepID=A0ABX4GXQ9_9BACI|nr:UTP--glucose-1-phosphate uridylyltransferase GalU [Terribacillus saccharophilus]PAD35266.1 UTP--glucose-1-phosphate uridylyltransferase [Terribacillus saccharophilus]PAD96015.1 UTP--glucose-1-phosphate uridylyltransferase [Terribacillus saccharophilus]PAD99661.1 UTP--glucose-1-phosphate uridylyltransferase [Terribacillus saccharophilus]
MRIKKAIIPAAGLGTRFLPATKAQPKEMLPIVDKPTIQYIVEEAVKSGIEDIIIVSGRGKRAIEDHFDKSYELEDQLIKKDKMKMLEEIQDISNLADIHYIRQKEAKGLGHAIATAKKFIGNEPFAVLLGDDIVKTDGTPALKQLTDAFEKYRGSVVGVQQVPDSEVSKYGVVAPQGSTSEPNLLQVSDLVEKPKLEDAPSNYAIMGRYVLTPEIFDILETLPPGAGGEIQLTDAIKELNKKQAVYACEFTGDRYDVGDKFGFIKATIEFALDRPDLKDQLQDYLNKSVVTENN